MVLLCRSDFLESPIERVRLGFVATSGSVYEVKIALSDPLADADRAEQIISLLKQQRRVDDLEGSWWRVELVDFEDRVAAIKAVEIELTELSADWQSCLVVG